jgi:poly-gamma-glutamate biosynthesis protein PgsC/CapC
MPDYDVTPDVVRIVLVVGVVVSMLFYEKVQLTTGGAIVPAYLALAVLRPLAIATTLLCGYAAFLVVNHLLAKRWILYGRRKFEIEVLVGLGLILLTTVAAGFAGRADPTLYGLAGIGFLVPGIVAHDMSRQRPGRTVLAILLVTALLAVVTHTLSSLLSIGPDRFGREDVQLASVLGYPRELLLYAVAASILVGMVVFARLGLRSGGFVTGAYLALVSPRWADLLFTVFVAVVTWAIVTRVLMPRLLMFGRRKLSTVVLVGAIVGWFAEVAVIHLTNGAYVPWRGLTVATIMVPALVANDAQRQGWERTAWGTTLTALGVFSLAELGAAGAIAAGWLGHA